MPPADPLAKMALSGPGRAEKRRGIATSILGSSDHPPPYLDHLQRSALGELRRGEQTGHSGLHTVAVRVRAVLNG